MKKIEITQPNPRIDDWRIILNGCTIGAVWRCRDEYIASVTSEVRTHELGAAFKVARKQARSITAA